VALPPTVVVPVFNGAEPLARCLRSLAKWPGVPVVLADDASTDPAVGAMLTEFGRSRPGTVVLRAAANGGFVANANAGAAAAAAGSDLLFLNADTEVTAGALDALRHALDSHPGAAAACPLSNNATFLSVPRYQQEAALPPGVAAEDMAALLRELDAAPLEAPTMVGFCVLVRRAAWDAHGPFDAAYGRGYGEDDDLAQRFRAAGHAVLAVPRAFVGHAGRASFGIAPHVVEQRRANGALLASRWPRYAEETAAFCRRNPLRPLHERLWDRLLAWPQRRAVHVLHVVPAWSDPWDTEALAIARATRDFANHTLVAPAEDRGAWLDAIDGPVESGIRVVGVPGGPAHIARFAQASPARIAHFHGEAWRDSPLPGELRAAGWRTLVTARASTEAARCVALYRRGA
jgi:GT2 family glycosyltransferase